MGEPALWGKPPPTRVIMGETAPDAVLEKAVAGYCQGYRKGYLYNR